MQQATPVDRVFASFSGSEMVKYTLTVEKLTIVHVLVCCAGLVHFGQVIYI